MVGTEPQGLKRKKPPTFRHLPEKRAKKLKQTWVANAKIKSKWKQQKRKEAALHGDNHEDDTFEGIKSEDEDSQLEDKDTSPSRSPTPPPAPSKPQHRSREERTHKDKQKAVSNSNAKSPKRQKQSKPRASDDESENEDDEKPSLRELTREAYSRGSLHTFKAGRGRGGNHTGHNTRGRGNGRGAMTGRGQPNMKLRMNAMLERIKQTVG